MNCCIKISIIETDIITRKPKSLAISLKFKLKCFKSLLRVDVEWDLSTSYYSIIIDCFKVIESQFNQSKSEKEGVVCNLQLSLNQDVSHTRAIREGNSLLYIISILKHLIVKNSYSLCSKKIVCYKEIRVKNIEPINSSDSIYLFFTNEFLFLLLFFYCSSTMMDSWSFQTSLLLKKLMN